MATDIKCAKVSCQFCHYGIESQSWWSLAYILYITVFTTTLHTRWHNSVTLYCPVIPRQMSAVTLRAMANTHGAMIAARCALQEEPISKQHTSDACGSNYPSITLACCGQLEDELYTDKQMSLESTERFGQQIKDLWSGSELRLTTS